MQTFTYKALTYTGKNKSGNLQASSITHAKQQLRNMQYLPVEVVACTESNKKSWFFKDIYLFKPKINTNTLVLITRQLSTLVGAGITIDNAFVLMHQQADNKIKKFIIDISDTLSTGESLSQALRKSSYSLAEEFIATIEAGEESGHMAEVLERLADDIERQAATASTLKAAAIYPIIMIIVAIGIVTLLMIYVVPQITAVFVNVKKDLPPLTEFIIWTSDFIRDYGLVITSIVATIAVAFIISMRKNRVRLYVHKKLINFPVIGEWIICTQISRWARNCGMLMDSGLPSLQSINIACRSASNYYVRQVLYNVAQHVTEGSSLYNALDKEKIFPVFVIHMSKTGESSGNLSKMLVKTADYYDQKMKITISTMLKVFEPMLILVMGAVVLVIVLAILMPIFDLNQMNV